MKYIYVAQTEDISIYTRVVNYDCLLHEVVVINETDKFYTFNYEWFNGRVYTYRILKTGNKNWKVFTDKGKALKWARDVLTDSVRYLLIK